VGFVNANDKHKVDARANEDSSAPWKYLCCSAQTLLYRDSVWTQHRPCCTVTVCGHDKPVPQKASVPWGTEGQWRIELRGQRV